MAKAKQAVEKAGFSYTGSEVIARGRAVRALDESNALLIEDPDAGMVIHLLEVDQDALLSLASSAAILSGEHVVQVRGTIDETNAYPRAQFTVRVSDFSAVLKESIPSLLPESSGQNDSPSERE